MRPYTKYLEVLTTEIHDVDFHLGGTTPPLPTKFAKKKVSLLLDQNSYKPRLLKLKTWIAGRAKARPEEVTLVPGSTQAAFQVLAAVTEVGDAVLIESPGYEPYFASAEFLGLKVRRYERTANLSEDLKKIRRLAVGAKALLISNPHCPTGLMYKPEEMKPLTQLGLTVIIDEVFLPLFCAGKLSHRPDVSADNLIFISGLSKSTGLGFSRIGWTVASAENARKIEAMRLLLHSNFPAPAAAVTEFAFKNWRAINAEILQLAKPNRKFVKKWAAGHSGVLSNDLSRAFFAMLKVPPNFSDGAAFTKELLKSKILVRDGAHFEMPGWVRFHILLQPKDFRAAFGKIASYY